MPTELLECLMVRLLWRTFCRKEKGLELLEKTKKISAILQGLIQTRKNKF